VRTCLSLVLVASAAAAAACGDGGRGAAPDAGDGSGGAAPAGEERDPYDVSVQPTIEWLVKGTGAQVKIDDVVEVHYVGTLADGSTFDSSRARDRPFAFLVGRGKVIEGWDRVLPQLRVGDRVVARIPKALGYGAVGIPGILPPNADLTFDVEVLSIVPEPSFEVVKAGDGPRVEMGRIVHLHFESSFPDGKVFESSRGQEQPFSFQAGGGQVIEAWDRAVLRMRVGDRWKVKAPWPYAFGADGRPPVIPPRQDVVFDLEVLRVE
jgi:peptidylprolyl isomerase